jgi:hypothetical protein
MMHELVKHWSFYLASKISQDPTFAPTERCGLMSIQDWANGLLVPHLLTKSTPVLGKKGYKNVRT